MENPATWGKAELVVRDALAQYGTNAQKFGFSLERCITDALREAGLLKDEEKPKVKAVDLFGIDPTFPPTDEMVAKANEQKLVEIREAIEWFRANDGWNDVCERIEEILEPEVGPPPMCGPGGCT